MVVAVQLGCGFLCEGGEAEYIRHMKKRKTPRKLSLVKFAPIDMPQEYMDKYPFDVGKVYVFHGELENMLGHCVVSDHPSGQVYSGHHTENFEELDED